MARSSNTVLTVAATTIVHDAVGVLNRLPQGAVLPGQELEDGLRALSMMVKTWMAPGNPIAPRLKVWQRATATLAPASAKISYDIWEDVSADKNMEIPVEILAFNVKDNDSDVETPLESMLFEDYWKIGDKTATGTPTRYCYQREYSKGVIYFDRVPEDVSDTYPFIYLRPLRNLENLNEDADFPNEYYEALKYHLALRLASGYGVNADPLTVQLAQSSLEMVQSFEPQQSGEDDYFQPNKWW
jgi:hypothetical protein